MTEQTGTHLGVNYSVSEEAAIGLEQLGIDVEKEITEAIEKDLQRKPAMKAEIYTKDMCGFCVKAKALFNQRGVEYTEINVIENRDELFERVIKDTGQAPRTVPQIYVDGSYVGGYTELVEFFKKQDAQ